MNQYAQTSSALKLVQQNPTPKRTHDAPKSTQYADIRKNLRDEAKMLSATGKSLLILGVFVSAMLCMVNGYILHELKNAAELTFIGVDSTTLTAAFVTMCVVGLVFAGMSTFLSLILFGVAETLRDESKRIK